MTRLRRQADVIWREIDGHGILLRVSSGDYCEINDVGLFIWKQIEQELPLDEVARRVAEAFDEEEATVSGDVLDFARALEKHDMIVIAPEKSQP